MKKYFLLSSAFLYIFALAFRPSSGFAQNPTISGSREIPSDLSLDLNFARKNPAPEQKTILESQINKAEVSTSNGEKTIITPKDILPKDIKTESESDADHPEQTTSEQVVSTSVNVGEKADTNNQNETSTQNQSDTTPQPEVPDNFIPSTTIPEPDDNAAPTEPAPTTNPSDNYTNQNTDQPTNSIPHENATNPQNDNQTQPPSDSSTQEQPTPDNGSSPDNSAVQGIQTGSHLSWWQSLVNLLFGNR